MKTWMLSLVTLSLGCISGVAVCDTVTYDFTVTAVNGPLNGDVSNGSFSFNSSIAPPAGGFVGQTGLLTALSFTWDGITYNSSTANTGFLGFNAAGNLTSVLFGDFCNAGSCGAGGDSETWFVQGSDAGSGFAYGVPSSPFGYTGTVSIFPALQPSSVPEPSTFSLLGLGLVGVGLIRRARKYLSRRGSGQAS